MISDSTEDFSVGKLERVIPANGCKRITYWPTIEVSWYYRKKDINREKNYLTEQRRFDAISDFEVFKSNHKDIIYIESIINKCWVYTLEEYEKLEEFGQSTFFTRASYDPKRQLLDPAFERWGKECRCKLPLNPDQLYIKCEICSRWFHPECYSISYDEINSIEFTCDPCKLREKLPNS